MKNILKVLFTFLSVAIIMGIVYSISNSNSNLSSIAQLTSLNSENVECQYAQCQATAKSTGNRCKHCVSNSGDTYCYQHD